MQNNFMDNPRLRICDYFNQALRVTGRIRRECLDHMIVHSEERLRRIVKDYFRHYHNSRPHEAAARNWPTPREIEPSSKGWIISIPQVGGLHHYYRRAA